MILNRGISGIEYARIMFLACWLLIYGTVELLEIIKFRTVVSQGNEIKLFNG